MICVGVTGRRVTNICWPRASSMAEAIAAPTALIPASPAPLTPSGLSGLGASSVIRTSTCRNLPGSRHHVIGERAGKRLTGFVVQKFLVQRAADALGNTSRDLPLDQHWIDRPADVIRDQVTTHLNTSGVPVDGHDSEMRAIGIRHVVAEKLTLGLEFVLARQFGQSGDRLAPTSVRTRLPSRMSSTSTGRS